MKLKAIVYYMLFYVWFLIFMRSSNSNTYKNYSMTDFQMNQLNFTISEDYD